jgi:hypothetical protein
MMGRSEEVTDGRELLKPDAALSDGGGEGEHEGLP